MEPKQLIPFLLSTKITGISSIPKLTVKHLVLSPAVRPVPQYAYLTVPNPGDMTFSDENSDYDESHGQQEGKTSGCDPTFGKSCTPSEPNLLTKEDLNNPVRDFNMSKKQAVFIGSTLKGWNLLH
jgi:hypothetical protein